MTDVNVAAKHKNIPNTSRYVPENRDLHEYTCDQTVLIHKPHLKYISRYTLEDKKPEQPDSSEWYPYVNSYYQYAEDFDAVNRVAHLLHEKWPRPGHIKETKKSHPAFEKDGYSEASTHEKMYRSQPVSFLILGKPELGEDQLGRFLAEQWRCVYIHPETLIKEEIESGSRAGLCIEFNLRCGRAISIDVIMRLLEKRMKCESIAHRGFVICGFPLISNDLFSEDPVSSETAIFNVNEIFEDLLESTFDLLNINEVVKYVSRTSQADLVEEEEEVEEPHEIFVPVKDVGVTNRDICYESHDNVDYTDQMNYIFRQLVQLEYFIVYLKCRNDEVVNCRKDLCCDAVSLEIVDGRSGRSEGADFYGLYPEDYGGGNINRKLLHLQKDQPAHVAYQLDHYIFESEPVIEKFMLLHDTEWIIRLDGRMDAQRMYHVLKTRLRVLPVTPNIVPEVIMDTGVPEEEVIEGPIDHDPINYDELSLPECFELFRKRKTAGPLYKWSLSDWGFMCPYAMYHNNYVSGVPKNAVQFLNKIFFLSTEEAVMHFTRNPRPYLLPPNPRPPCKAFVMGAKYSGKTQVAHCIRYMLEGKILHGGLIKKNYSQNKADDIIAALTNQARMEALELLQQLHEERQEEAENSRDAELQAFISDVKHHIEQYFKNKSIVEARKSIEYTSLPAPSSKTVSKHVLIAQDIMDEIELYFKSFNIPIDVPTLTDMLTNDAYIAAYAPQELSERVLIPQISTDEAFVDEYISNVLKKEEHKLKRGQLSPEDLAECFMNAIDEVEDSGWVVDGLPLNVEVFKIIKDRNMGNLIIILKDTSEGMECLKHRRARKLSLTTDYADFFSRRGLVQAAEFAKVSQASDAEEARLSEIANLSEDQVNADEYWSKLEKDYGELIEYFNASGIKYVEFSITDKSVEGLMLDVVRFIKGQFCQKAIVLTEEDRVNERGDYGENHVEDEEVGGEDDGDRDEQERFFMDNRRMGDCGCYDAVAYGDYGVLWRGKEELCVKYINSIYLFGNQANLDAFVFEPLKYRLNEAPKLLPPPRICVTGVNRIGKTTQARLLSKRLGLIYVGYEENFTEIDYETYNLSVLNRLWFDEPFKTIGVVLDGYPRSSQDVDFMCRHLLIPDVILEMACSAVDLNNRLLSILLEEWRVQMEINKVIETQQFAMLHDEWETEYSVMFKRLIAEKRDMRYKKMLDLEEENVALRTSAVSFRSVDEADDLRLVEMELDDLLPEPIFDNNWETEENASERILAAIEESNEGVHDAILETRASSKIELLPWSTIDANLAVEKIYNIAVREVIPIKYRNTSFFERIYDISIDLSEKLLQQGYYLLSRFGKTCPVQLYENHNLLQMYLRDEKKFHIFPMVHRQYIYFISGVDNRTQFKNDVLKYINQKNCKLPLFPLRLSVIGPPKSGKTTLSERIQFEYGLKHISIGKALRYVLKYLPQSVLGLKLESLLRKGKRPDCETCMQCVEAISFDNISVAAGFIMDGFPNTIEDIKILAGLNLIPHLIIEIEADLDYIHEYMDINENLHHPEFSKKFITHRHNTRQININQFRKYLNSEYQNLALIPIQPSKWHFWRDANEILLAVVSEIKYYYKNKDKSTVLRIANMLVTPMEFVNRASSFKNYCPCCLYHENLLYTSGNPPDRTNLLQYQSKYYWLCEAHVDEFIYNPDSFLGPNAKHSLPNHLPIRVQFDGNPKTTYEKGLCVVCIEKNLPKRVTNEGLPSLSVQYVDVIYLFDTEECLNQFMMQPHKYCNAKKVGLGGIMYPAMNINDLPTLGLLEQFDAQQLVRAVIHTESLRPLVPGLDIKASALINLGLFLKINNPSTPQNCLSRYDDARNNFIDRCTTLIETMKIMKTTINPLLHYEEPVPDPFARVVPERVVEKPVAGPVMKHVAAYQVVVEPGDDSSGMYRDDSESVRWQTLKSRSTQSSSTTDNL